MSSYDTNYKIAIACHCPKSKKKLSTTMHPSLYLHMNNDKGGVGIPIKDTATYIDPFEGCDSWDDLVKTQPNSFDVIFAYHCSVGLFYRDYGQSYEGLKKYMSIDSDNNREMRGVTTDLFLKGWKLLRPGGVLIFGTDKDTNIQNFIEGVSIVVPNMVNNWHIPKSKISSEDYPFYIDDNPNNEPPSKEFPFLLVFTKDRFAMQILEGGRSRKNKSRKNKSRKNKSRK
jgi:hypothetical protein